MTPQQVKKLDLDASNLTAYSYTEGRVGYLQINCNRVTDENVRKALLFAMDRKAMDDAPSNLTNTTAFRIPSCQPTASSTQKTAWKNTSRM